MFDRFTDRARKVCNIARQEAERLKHDYIGTEHLLIGLIDEGTGVAVNVLENLDVDLKKLRNKASESMKPAPPETMLGPQLPFTEHAKKALLFAIDEARLLGANYVGTEHLLLGLLHDEGAAGMALSKAGLNLETVRKEVAEFLGAEIKDRFNYEEIIKKEAEQKNQKLESLRIAIFQLNELERDILTRRYVSNESVEQIAIQLNLPADEIERRIAESKEKIMKMLFGGK